MVDCGLCGIRGKCTLLRLPKRAYDGYLSFPFLPTISNLEPSYPIARTPRTV